eukprot:gene11298-18934_t
MHLAHSRTGLRAPAPLKPHLCVVDTPLSLIRRPICRNQETAPPRAKGSGSEPVTISDISYARKKEMIGQAAKLALTRATAAVKRYGWLGFWIQLTLSVISSIILLFSVAFTSASGPRSALYLTLLGILAGFLSCFWNFVYTRTGLKMQQFLNGNGGSKVKKQSVIDMVTRGVIINIVGMGSTLLGIQAMVGLLVAKTLSTATSNPFATAASYNPVLALDVFLVQAATNTLLGHFLSLICSLWLLNVLGEGKGFQAQSKGKVDWSIVPFDPVDTAATHIHSRIASSHFSGAGQGITGTGKNLDREKRLRCTGGIRSFEPRTCIVEMNGQPVNHSSRQTRGPTEAATS